MTLTPFYDNENNPTIPERYTNADATQIDRAAISEFHHVRLLVAAELCRCGIITSLDAALDDADTVLGVLNRHGYVRFGRDVS